MSLATAVGRPKPRPATPALRVVERAPDPDAIRAFFEADLPRLIARRADAFNAVRGSLAIFVEGAGSWTVQFGDHTSAHALTVSASFESDCVAVFTISTFSSLLSGKVEGASVVIGEARLLSRLGQVMVEPARGPLGARLNGAVARR